MPRVKIARKSTLVDMTPMCDVAFLLLTFFMLTTKFKPDDPVEVITPAAISTTLLPEAHVALVTIAKDGRVFFGLDDQNQRLQLIQDFNQQYKLGLTPEEMKTYSLSSSVGMPLNGLKQFLSLPAEQREAFTQTGVPVDSATEELGQWIKYTLSVNNNNPDLQFVIKADDNTKFDVVNKVLKIMKKQNQHKLHLITSMKAIPPGTPAYESAQRTGTLDQNEGG